MKIFKFVDSIWLAASHRAGIIAGIVMICGLLLFGFSMFLGLADVDFIEGRLIDGIRITDADGQPLTIRKQVGFATAPNWLLTALLLLPLALLYLFRARAAIEPLIVSLIERGMIVRIDAELVDQDSFMQYWKKSSLIWSVIATIIFVAVVLFTIVSDFFPVVVQWNIASPDDIRAMILADEITIGHKTFEFDWSVASIFQGSRISGWANILFASFAYLVVPVFGSAVMFSAMTWLFAAHAVFNASSLEGAGYRLQPDLGSDDNRCGFEAFEEFFDNLVKAAFLTALIVVAMHLQNVFLRSPLHENILDMAFGDTFTGLIRSLMAFDIVGIVAALSGIQTTADVLSTKTSQLSFQTYIAAVALAMLAAIVFGMVWGWLRNSAIRGRRRLLQQLEREEQPDKKKIGRLENMVVWPIGWGGIVVVMSATVIVMGCMVFPRFLVIVFGMLLAFAAAYIVSHAKKRITNVFKLKIRPRRESEDD